MIKYIIINIIETLFRGFPVQCKTGLIKIGSPNRNSPIFLTCNYHLTVERVKRALNGINCYLLVANSNGYNVWCGAAGGHFSNHSVISVLKTSGIEDLVDKRNVILPQLAAAGIEGRTIREKTGWDVIWGPVYIKDISIFIRNEFKKTSEMRNVRFPLAQRIEMTAMWAFPFSISTSLITALFWPEIVLPLIGLTWGLPFLIFMSFPVYSRWLNRKKKGIVFSRYTVIFDFGRIPLILWGSFIICLIIFSLLTDLFMWGFILRWGLISFIIVLIVSLDLMGSTPVYKSGLHEDRFLKVILDEKKCRGVGFCEQVCPRNCYKVDRNRNIAAMPGSDLCVQCGACIIQCPFDALYFKGPKGKMISPQTIRKFKLNLLGKRLARVGRKK